MTTIARHTDNTSLRERKKRELEGRLTDVALRLFLERGYADVTVDDIAAEANVSTRTFFRYFPSKKDVAVAGPFRLGESLPEHVASADPGRDPIEAARDAVRVFAARRQSLPDGLAQATMILQTPELASRLARERQTWARDVAKALEPSIGGGDAALAARVIASNAIFTLAAAFDTWIEERGARPLPEILEIAFDVVDALHAARQADDEAAA